MISEFIRCRFGYMDAVGNYIHYNFGEEALCN